MQAPLQPFIADMLSSGFKPVDPQAIIERLPIGVMVCALDEERTVTVHSLNAFASSIFDPDDIPALPAPLEQLINSSDHHSLLSQLFDAFNLAQQTSLEWSIQQGAVERALSSQILPVIDESGAVSQVICTLEDRTAEKMAERNLLHHAFHDALTGQPNRVLFRNRLEDAVADCERDDSDVGVAVLIINIDRFQQINDSFGHSVGDRFLVAISKTLQRCIRGKDTLARLSGDEFAILVEKCASTDEIFIITDRIHETMEQPYDMAGNEIFTSVSIGVATSLESNNHPEDLIRDADYAMHRAKSRGKARTEFFKRDVHTRVRANFHLETELRRAVERDDLAMHMQPIVKLEKSSLASFEGLARWHHKEKGVVSPVEFIPLAEETGVIVQLGRWAINKACQSVKGWQTAYGVDKVVPVNVNVSGVQFARDDVADMIKSALDHHGISGDKLRVELTESAIMANPSRIARTLNKIRDLGVKVALDDFGAGYSSLNYLHEFPIDIIKIDRSFINRMQVGNQTYEILRMIANLAHALGNSVVAEGLEDPAQVAMLSELGIDFGQGFFFSKPVNMDAADTMLAGTLPW